MEWTLYPKSEVEKVKTRQDAEAEFIWKKRTHIQRGLGRIFQKVYAR